jgi:hypothetical protein
MDDAILVGCNSSRIKVWFLALLKSYFVTQEEGVRQTLAKESSPIPYKFPRYFWSLHSFATTSSAKIRKFIF